METTLTGRIKVWTQTLGHKETLRKFGYEVETSAAEFKGKKGKKVMPILLVKVSKFVVGSKDEPVDVSTPEKLITAAKELYSAKAAWTYGTWFKWMDGHVAQGFEGNNKHLRDLGALSALVMTDMSEPVKAEEPEPKLDLVAEVMK